VAQYRFPYASQLRFLGSKTLMLGAQAFIKSLLLRMITSDREAFFGVKIPHKIGDTTSLKCSEIVMGSLERASHMLPNFRKRVRRGRRHEACAGKRRPAQVAGRQVRPPRI
jgi:hypothetical protein